MNLPLPMWCTDDIYNTLEEMFVFSLDAMSMTQKLKRLNGGILIRQMLENISRNNNSTGTEKIYLYSSHDLTLAGFTRAQKMMTFKFPPFGSAIIMEKYTDNQNNKYIKVVQSALILLTHIFSVIKLSRKSFSCHY